MNRANFDPAYTLDPAWAERHAPPPVYRRPKLTREERGATIAHKATPDRRAMTPAEIAMVGELGGCTFASGSPDKRFARSMQWEALRGEKTITDGQATYLLRLAHRYRRQAPDAHRLAGCCEGGGEA